MIKKAAKPILILLALVLALCMATSCGSSQPETGGSSAQTAGSSADGSGNSDDGGAVGTGKGLEDAPEIAGLTLESKMDTQYATEFEVYYYSDGYKLLNLSDGRQYLIVPEGKEVPEGADEDLIILQAPLDNTYLAATSAMALIVAIGALDDVKMSGTDASGWYIPEAADALNDGSILFAGKYSEPDYEMLIDQECDLAIESTMILHTPKVQEMIEKMDIPVFIDRSSYESHPLGRTEWIKLYGALFDKEEEAQAVFDEKAKILDDMEGIPNSEKTVAFFNVKKDGTVTVRNPKDYVSTMIDLGGARYAFRDLDVAEDASSSVNISMEEFYATAEDADYLIYNATFSDPIKTTDDLIALNDLFADFKAVKEGNVWCSGNNMYQATDNVADFILDVNRMVNGGTEDDMVFLTKVN